VVTRAAGAAVEAVSDSLERWHPSKATDSRAGSPKTQVRVTVITPSLIRMRRDCRQPTPRAL